MTGSVDVLDATEFAIGDMTSRAWSGSLHTVSHRKYAFDLAVDRHALQPPRVVGDPFAHIAPNRDEIPVGLDGLDARVFARLDAEHFASRRISHHIADLVP